jgi:hypothetical protein
MSRRALLAEFNIEWVQLTSSEFTEEVLVPLMPAASAGLDFIRSSGPSASAKPSIPDVAYLSRAPMQPSDFLLGQEPVWGDLQSGRAISRVCDRGFLETTDRLLSKSGPRGVLLITGTAGSGKTTALMRLALTLSSAGTRVGWIDRETEISVRDIRRLMKNPEAPAVLAIDEADMFGSELSPLLRELTLSASSTLVMLAIRSGKVERALNADQLQDVPLEEVTVPLLADSDIDGLLDALSKEQRLGVLKGLSRAQQVHAFREQAGRELPCRDDSGHVK